MDVSLTPNFINHDHERMRDLDVTPIQLFRQPYDLLDSIVKPELQLVFLPILNQNDSSSR
jgi:hypothetical protein